MWGRKSCNTCKTCKYFITPGEPSEFDGSCCLTWDEVDKTDTCNDYQR